MFKRILFLGFVLLTVAFSAQAQKGFVRGKITDGENGEGMFGATIVVKGTSNGTTSDFDGNYSLPLEAGTYTLVYSFVSYTTQEVTEVKVVGEEVTTINITLSTNDTMLGDVVVTAERLRDDETAMLSMKNKAINSIDGISSTAFKKIGDSDLSSAMKRVTGVSVQGGKYVYVRGLGDRYSKTTLNGMAIPGLDPDRNDVQIDLFPTSILENVVVYKTFSPNLAGDFTGGLINVETKAFPEEKYTTVSVGFSYNPDMNLQSDFLTQESSGLDFLALGASDREIGIGRGDVVPQVTQNDPRLTEYTRRMSPNLATERGNSFLNHSLSFAHGNQINKEKVTFGYNAVMNYRRSFKHYQNAVNNQFEINNDPTINSLIADKFQNGPRSEDEVLWSTLLSGSMKFEKHSFSLNFLHIQNANQVNIQRLAASTGLNNLSDLDNDIMKYTQRSLTNVALLGKHQLSEKLQLEWKNAITFSNVDEPDFRNTLIDVTDPPFYSIESNGAGINRYSRVLDEINENFAVDLAYDLNEKVKLRTGVNFLYKQRESDLLQFDLKVEGIGVTPNDPSWYLDPNNIWTVASGQGTYVLNFTQPQNAFEATQTVLAGYIMGEVDVTEKFKAIFGVRAEQAFMYYTGERANSGGKIDNEKTLDALDFLPSVNLVYKLKDNMNLRGSYNRTLARPSFREKSDAFIPDPISGLTFLGNLNLESANIDNYDLRWEFFFQPEEMVSISGFYKRFTNHIIMANYLVDPEQIRPRNVPESSVFGIEIEARKKLDFIAAPLKNFSAGVNVSLVTSKVDRTKAPVNDPDVNGNFISEYDDRLSSARDGQSIDTDREMVGQAPFLINGFLSYAQQEKGIDVNLSYNVQGETLTIRGVALTPDIYTKPFHSLNLNIRKRLGAEGNSTLGFGVKNILDDDRRLVYRNADSREQIFSLLNPGRSFSVSYSYTF